MKLERVLLGPASGNRDYGLLGTSPTLRLADRQGATLTELIFGARSTISTLDPAAVFVPIAGRNGDLWALAQIRPEPFESGIRIFADALILTRTQLDAIGWSAHRLLDRSWGDRRSLEAITIDESRLWDSDAADEKAFRVDALISEAPSGVWIACQGGVDPTKALCSTLDALLPETRSGLSYSSAPTLRWTPPDTASATFDVTATPGTAPQGATAMGFDHNGPMVQASAALAWESSLYEFRRRRPLNWRRTERRAVTRPTNHETAFLALLDRYTSHNPHQMLAEAAGVGAKLHNEGRIDAAAYDGLSKAVLARFERDMGGLDSAGAAQALAVFDTQVAPNLAERPPGMAARLAVNARAMTFLEPEAVRTIAPQLFGLPQILRNATALLQSSGGLQETYAAWAVAIQKRVETDANPDTISFAAALFSAALRHPKPASQDVYKLSITLIRLGKSRYVADEARRWGADFRARKMNAEDLKQRLTALSKPLVEARRSGTLNLHDSRSLSVWLAIDEVAALAEDAAGPVRGGRKNAGLSSLWNAKR
jgi:hypothetical protein